MAQKIFNIKSKSPTKPQKTFELDTRPLNPNIDKQVIGLKRVSNRGKNIKDLSWDESKRKYPNLNPRGDADNDGTININDCAPFDEQRHGLFGSIKSAVSSAVSRVVSAVTGGSKPSTNTSSGSSSNSTSSSGTKSSGTTSTSSSSGSKSGSGTSGSGGATSSSTSTSTSTSPFGTSTSTPFSTTTTKTGGTTTSTSGGSTTTTSGGAKTGSYVAGKGFVTSDGKTYPTTNASWTPSGYTSTTTTTKTGGSTTTTAGTSSGSSGINTLLYPKGTFDPITKTYTDPSGNKQSMASAPAGASVIVSAFSSPTTKTVISGGGGGATSSQTGLGGTYNVNTGVYTSTSGVQQSMAQAPPMAKLTGIGSGILTGKYTPMAGGGGSTVVAGTASGGSTTTTLNNQYILDNPNLYSAEIVADAKAGKYIPEGTQKAGYYVQGQGFVTTTGQVYKTNDKNFIPPGYVNIQTLYEKPTESFNDYRPVYQGSDLLGFQKGDVFIPREAAINPQTKNYEPEKVFKIKESATTKGTTIAYVTPGGYLEKTISPGDKVGETKEQYVVGSGVYGTATAIPQITYGAIIPRDESSGKYGGYWYNPATGQTMSSQQDLSSKGYVLTATPGEITGGKLIIDKLPEKAIGIAGPTLPGTYIDSTGKTVKDTMISPDIRWGEDTVKYTKPILLAQRDTERAIEQYKAQDIASVQRYGTLAEQGGASGKNIGAWAGKTIGGIVGATTGAIKGTGQQIWDLVTPGDRYSNTQWLEDIGKYGKGGAELGNKIISPVGEVFGTGIGTIQMIITPKSEEEARLQKKYESSIQAKKDEQAGKLTTWDKISTGTTAAILSIPVVKVLGSLAGEYSKDTKKAIDEATALRGWDAPEDSAGIMSVGQAFKDVGRQGFAVANPFQIAEALRQEKITEKLSKPLYASLEQTNIKLENIKNDLIKKEADRLGISEEELSNDYKRMNRILERGSDTIAIRDKITGKEKIIPIPDYIKNLRDTINEQQYAEYEGSTIALEKAGYGTIDKSGEFSLSPKFENAGVKANIMTWDVLGSRTSPSQLSSKESTYLAVQKGLSDFAVTTATFKLGGAAIKGALSSGAKIGQYGTRILGSAEKTIQLQKGVIKLGIGGMTITPAEYLSPFLKQVGSEAYAYIKPVVDVGLKTSQNIANFAMKEGAGLYRVSPFANIVDLGKGAYDVTKAGYNIYSPIVKAGLEKAGTFAIEGTKKVGLGLYEGSPIPRMIDLGKGVYGTSKAAYSIYSPVIRSGLQKTATYALDTSKRIGTELYQASPISSLTELGRDVYGLGSTAYRIGAPIVKSGITTTGKIATRTGKSIVKFGTKAEKQVAAFNEAVLYRPARAVGKAVTDKFIKETPLQYARRLQKEGKLIIKYSDDMGNNQASFLRGKYTESGINELTIERNLKARIGNKAFQETIAHELIHYKTPGFLLDAGVDLGIPYRYRLSEILAYGLEKPATAIWTKGLGGIVKESAVKVGSGVQTGSKVGKVLVKGGIQYAKAIRPELTMQAAVGLPWLAERAITYQDVKATGSEYEQKMFWAGTIGQGIGIGTSLAFNPLSPLTQKTTKQLAEYKAASVKMKAGEIQSSGTEGIITNKWRDFLNREFRKEGVLQPKKAAVNQETFVLKPLYSSDITAKTISKARPSVYSEKVAANPIKAKKFLEELKSDLLKEGYSKRQISNIINKYTPARLVMKAEGWKAVGISDITGKIEITKGADLTKPDQFVITGKSLTGEKATVVISKPRYREGFQTVSYARENIPKELRKIGTVDISPTYGLQREIILPGRRETITDIMKAKLSVTKDGINRINLRSTNEWRATIEPTKTLSIKEIDSIIDNRIKSGMLNPADAAVAREALGKQLPTRELSVFKTTKPGKVRIEAAEIDTRINKELKVTKEELANKGIRREEIKVPGTEGTQYRYFDIKTDKELGIEKVYSRFDVSSVTPAKIFRFGPKGEINELSYISKAATKKLQEQEALKLLRSTYAQEQTELIVRRATKPSEAIFSKDLVVEGKWGAPQFKTSMSGTDQLGTNRPLLEVTSNKKAVQWTSGISKPLGKPGEKPKFSSLGPEDRPIITWDEVSKTKKIPQIKTKTVKGEGSGWVASTTMKDIKGTKTYKTTVKEIKPQEMQTQDLLSQKSIGETQAISKTEDVFRKEQITEKLTQQQGSIDLGVRKLSAARVTQRFYPKSFNPTITKDIITGAKLASTTSVGGIFALESTSALTPSIKETSIASTRSSTEPTSVSGTDFDTRAPTKVTLSGRSPESRYIVSSQVPAQITEPGIITPAVSTTSIINSQSLSAPLYSTGSSYIGPTTLTTGSYMMNYPVTSLSRTGGLTIGVGLLKNIHGGMEDTLYMNKTMLMNKIIIFQNYLLKYGMMTEYMIMSKEMLLGLDKFVLMERLRYLQEQVRMLKMRMSQKSQMATRQQLVQNTISRSKSRFARYRRIRMPKIKKPKIIIPKIILPEGKGKSKRISAEAKVKEQGYEVLVRRKGVFKSLGVSAPKAEAEALGIREVLGGAAATYKLAPTGKAAKSIGIRASPGLTGLFRTGKREGERIQKERLRILSPGEKREISQVGIAARAGKSRTKVGRKIKFL